LVGIAMKTDVFPSYVVFNATDSAEYLALTASNKSLYQLLISQGLIDLADNKNAKTVLCSIFGVETTTRANILALTSTKEM
jgi:hypothetical protein